MIQLNDIFSVATLVNLLTGSLILVIFCFMGSNLASPNDLIQYFMGAGSVVLELYVMCMYSQKIRDCVSSFHDFRPLVAFLKFKKIRSLICFDCLLFFKSAAIGESAYESGWFGKGVAYKKGIVSMIQRSHRIISLSAFKFGELSKDLFTEVHQFIDPSIQF